jgi:LPXTG-site transpeptidase (sortase) family protein
MCTLIVMFLSFCWTAPPLPIGAGLLNPPPPPQSTALHIPALGVSSEITTFPLGYGTWEINPWERQVGHFQGTAWDGHIGNIVIGGHSEYPSGVEAVFYDLHQLKWGDVIWLDIDGTRKRYIITQVTTVDMYNLDPVRPTSDNRLTLITCDVPSYDQATGIYDERVVVVAHRLP